MNSSTFTEEVDAHATSQAPPESSTLSFCKLDHVTIFEKVYNYVRLIECFISFCGNCLTILAVMKFNYLNRKPHNILIVGLAFADGFLGEIL